MYILAVTATHSHNSALTWIIKEICISHLFAQRSLHFTMKKAGFINVCLGPILYSNFSFPALRLKLRNKAT